LETIGYLFDTQTPIYEIVARLALALVLSMALGYEREAFNRRSLLRGSLRKGLGRDHRQACRIPVPTQTIRRLAQV
jgi:hypothetical protein